MRKHLFILSTIFIILGYGVYWAFYDMSRLPKGEFIMEVISPDKRHSIKSYVSSPALSGITVRAELNYLTKSKSPKNIYWEYDKVNADIKWLDNETVIINGRKLNVFNEKYDWRRE